METSTAILSSTLLISTQNKSSFVNSSMLESFPTRLAKFILCVKLSPTTLTSNPIKWQNTIESENSQAILKLVNELLAENSERFSDLLKNLTFDETSIGAAFDEIAEEVLCGDNKDITWSRIAILYAFASTMAKTCLPTSPSFLETFSSIVGSVIEHYTGNWVEKQGGWMSVKVDGNKQSASDIFKGFLGIGTTVLGAAFTLFYYGKTTSTFTTLLKH